MRSLFPQYNHNEGIISSGTLIEAVPKCKNRLSSACKKHYEKMFKSTDGFYICPKGMTTYVQTTDSKKTIFTCFKVNEYYDKTKHKKSNLKFDGFSPIFPKERVISLLSLDHQNSTKDDLIHDIKKLNARINDRIDQVWNRSKEKDPLNVYVSTDTLQSIQACSRLIDLRFSMYDFIANAASLRYGTQFRCNIYKKFDKCIRLVNSSRKKLKIYIEGESYREINAYPNIDFIPYILLDNAVKYSYEGQEIKIKFLEKEANLQITVESYSPYCSPEELSLIFTRGYRGDNAIKISSATGSGIGLYFAKALCDLHEIDIYAESSDNTSEINGISYSLFKFHLILKTPT